MKITEQTNELLIRTKAIIEANGFTEDDDYRIGFQNNWSRKGNNISRLTVTLPFDEDVCNALKEIGWKIEREYENNGSPSIFCSDLHCDDYKLYELIERDQKKVTMIRMSLRL